MNLAVPLLSSVWTKCIGTLLVSLLVVRTGDQASTRTHTPVWTTNGISSRVGIMQLRLNLKKLVYIFLPMTCVKGKVPILLNGIHVARSIHVCIFGDLLAPFAPSDKIFKEISNVFQAHLEPKVVCDS